MFSFTDVAAFAAKHHQGDRTAAVEALLRNGPDVKYVPNRAYADAKLIIAWWAAALARRLPSGMAVYAVSPGGFVLRSSARRQRTEGLHRAAHPTQAVRAHLRRVVQEVRSPEEKGYRLRPAVRPVRSRR